ncbi:MAG TPA: hypothetical protein VGH74_18215, partial [Planctomycetaceae bacterium]
MPAPIEKLKAAILSPDEKLRIAAVDYFARGNVNDPSIVGLVMQAFDLYGDDAIELSNPLPALVQTDKSVEWICRRIDALAEPANPRQAQFYFNLLAALCDADVALLERHAD